MSENLKIYLKQIAETTLRGDAREESYYSYLKSLVELCAGSRKTSVTVLPKKTDAGNPDFRVWDGAQHITGYIEAKIPGTNLDIVETSEQLQRYLHVFPNLILTDFYEFRLYREGRMTMKVSIGRPFVVQRLRTLPPLENEQGLMDLFAQFFSFSLPRTFTAEGLAVELAKRTRFLRDEVISAEMREGDGQKGAMHGFYRAFQKYLLPDLDETQFADLYAQTLTYGLFAARSRSSGEFTRVLAFQYIPSTIGILRDVFQFISLGKLPVQMEVIVDDIADVLAVADLEKILRQFEKAGKGTDPVVHFYETFLSAYDPRLREKRGVYYTPEPVVGYIVRSLHALLKSEFKLADGLADPAVTLLDPAAGTLTFPAEAIRTAVKEYTSKYGEGGKVGLIKNQLLRNTYAFELMMAPYAIGHLKMSLLMEELGCPLEGEERFQLYLTNSLSMEDIQFTEMPGLNSLSEENHAALKVKQKNILVILGNPPYSGISANKSEWTEQLLKTNMDGAQSYYVIDDQPLGERNPKWLQDDYVKFLRFAQWKIQKAGKGMVGMITNHGYLDNPTFRGMRQSLMKTFNEIYVLNLHGNSLKKERTPEGGKDENVFDIRTGVAVVLMVKHENMEGCSVQSSDLYGTREVKYDWLNSHDKQSTEFKDVKSSSPWYFFQKNSLDKLVNYHTWFSIDYIFPKNSVGIVTGRDNLTVKMTENDAFTSALSFSKMDIELARQAFDLREDSRDWKISLAQKDLNESTMDKSNVKPISYRPFDNRFTYYTGKSRGFHCMARNDVMRHMLFGNNVGLITRRQQIIDKKCNYFFISDKIISDGVIRSDNKGSESFFPLFLYPKTFPGQLFAGERTPNIVPGLLEKLGAAYGHKPSPEELLAYIYGVFYSNIYRETYAEALRIDFPRVPFTNDLGIFERMAALGQRLIDLHLLKSSELDLPVARYQGSGSDTIEKVEYDVAAGRVRINVDKYFEGISNDVWQYQIGGYQVLDKYLKYRKGRAMDDPRRYCQIATALAKTIQIQSELDEIYPEIENALLDIQIPG